MSEPRLFFSIIIPTYNRPKELSRCLEAICQVDYSRDVFEVIVVNDGSRVPLEPVVSSFQDRINIRLLNQENGGPARARNNGLSKAVGRYVLFTDDDCRIDSGILRKLEAYFVSCPDDGVVGFTKNDLGDNIFSEASQYLMEYLYSYYNVRPNQARFANANNIAFSVDELRRAGGFNDSMPFAGGEDREIGMRWVATGHRLVFDKEMVVHHFHHLDLKSFLSQHYIYGRGAYHFRLASSKWGNGRIQVEPLSFYLRMFALPFTKMPWPRAATISFLLFLTQYMNALGFFREKFRCRKK